MRKNEYSSCLENYTHTKVFFVPALIFAPKRAPLVVNPPTLEPTEQIQEIVLLRAVIGHSLDERINLHYHK